MSSTYSTEPGTHGKVVLRTSVGDLDVELWAKECPLACRCFLTWVLRGSYDGTLFDRIVHDFIVQHAGCGEEDDGSPRPKEEFHPRIRFNHRGQVAFVKGSRSKFFVTLAAAPHLKATIFGKVTGPTVFNLLRMGSVPTDEDECPEYPVKLLSAEVLLNPFDDLVVERVARKADVAGSESGAVVQKKRKATKNTGLLSFGGGGSEDSSSDSDSSSMGNGNQVSKRKKQPLVTIRMKSAHEDAAMRQSRKRQRKLGSRSKMDEAGVVGGDCDGDDGVGGGGNDGALGGGERVIHTTAAITPATAAAQPGLESAHPLAAEAAMSSTSSRASSESSSSLAKLARFSSTAGGVLKKLAPDVESDGDDY